MTVKQIEKEYKKGSITLMEACNKVIVAGSEKLGRPYANAKELIAFVKTVQNQEILDKFAEMFQMAISELEEEKKIMDLPVITVRPDMPQAEINSNNKIVTEIMKQYVVVCFKAKDPVLQQMAWDMYEKVYDLRRNTLWSVCRHPKVWKYANGTIRCVDCSKSFY